ncbi:artemin isoform X1 [Artibeus jamaicensis]|uniref:artemin isoform X1 n=1 Tax=Artibeus jamaicensis TaxID=9417 RepID=UPI00235AD622|nr:artemin isoform X1 [Artibeus jamaicensis]
MEQGRGGPSVLPRWPLPRRQAPLCLSAQPALWPTLAILVLLSSVAEASLGLAPRSPATREGPAPAPAPPVGHLPGGRPFRSCSGRRPAPQPPRPAPPPSAPAPVPSRGGRAARAWGRSGSARAVGARSCRLRSQLVPVHALGLGHSSDELVHFRFCSGSCRRERSAHDLSLAKLLGAGALRLLAGSQPVSQPCCRPTRYEAVSFMDVNSTWRTVDRLSATACGCLG